MPLILEHLDSAVTALDGLIALSENTERMEQLSELEQTAIRAGVIQHFEVAYALSMTLIDRWLEENIGPGTAKGKYRIDVYRAAAEQRLIDDPEAWFAHHVARNHTSHIYDGERAMEVYRATLIFAKDARRLLRALEARND